MWLNYYYKIITSLQVHEGKKDFSLSAIGQLIWREYFYTMSVNNIHYNKMVENPICLNIPWYKDAEKMRKWTEVCTSVDTAVNLYITKTCHAIYRIFFQV